LPPFAGLFTFILDTSQMIVKFYHQTVIRYELNLELYNSCDKRDKFYCLSKVHYTQNTSRS